MTSCFESINEHLILTVNSPFLKSVIIISEMLFRNTYSSGRCSNEIGPYWVATLIRFVIPVEVAELANKIIVAGAVSVKVNWGS